jgi:hypothetical protein
MPDQFGNPTAEETAAIPVQHRGIMQYGRPPKTKSSSSVNQSLRKADNNSVSNYKKQMADPFSKLNRLLKRAKNRNEIKDEINIEFSNIRFGGGFGYLPNYIANGTADAIKNAGIFEGQDFTVDVEVKQSVDESFRQADEQNVKDNKVYNAAKEAAKALGMAYGTLNGGYSTTDSSDQPEFWGGHDFDKDEPTIPSHPGPTHLPGFGGGDTSWQNDIENTDVQRITETMWLRKHGLSAVDPQIRAIVLELNQYKDMLPKDLTSSFKLDLLKMYDFAKDLYKVIEMNVGVPVLYQNEGQLWSDLKFQKNDGKGTVSSSACSIMSLTMAMYKFGGSLLPYQALEFASNKDRYRKDRSSGVHQDLFRDYAALFGVDFEQIGTIDDKDNNNYGKTDRKSLGSDETYQRLKETLNNGGSVIMRAGTEGKNIFTDYGHYVVIVGVDKNGEFIVNDPNKRNYNGVRDKFTLEKTFRFKDLSEEANNFYLFTKE